MGWIPILAFNLVVGSWRLTLSWRSYGMPTRSAVRHILR